MDINKFIDSDDDFIFEIGDGGPRLVSIDDFLSEPDPYDTKNFTPDSAVPERDVMGISTPEDRVTTRTSVANAGHDIKKAVTDFPAAFAEGAEKTLEATKIAAADAADLFARKDRDAYWDEGIEGTYPAGPEADRQRAYARMGEIDQVAEARRKADPYRTDLGENFGATLESIGYMAPGIVGAVVTRNPMVMASVLGTRTGIDAVGEKRASGEGKGAAWAHGVISGTAETALEMIPSAKLFDLFGKKAGASLLGKLTKYFAAEELTEVPTTLIQNASDIMFSKDGGQEKAKDYVEQYLHIAEEAPISAGGKTFNAREDFKNTLIQTAMQTGLMGAAGKVKQTASRALMTEEEKAQADQQQAAWDAMTPAERKELEKKDKAARIREIVQGRTAPGTAYANIFGRTETEQAPIDPGGPAPVAPPPPTGETIVDLANKVKTDIVNMENELLDGRRRAAAEQAAAQRQAQELETAAATETATEPEPFIDFATELDTIDQQIRNVEKAPFASTPTGQQRLQELQQTRDEIAGGRDATLDTITEKMASGTPLTDAEEQTRQNFAPDVESRLRARQEASRVVDEAHQAATSPTNDLPEPTEAQKEAGNYKKGHIKLHGMDIAIENPKGSERSGTDTDGERWSVTMPAHYGYVKRTEGADGDQVDVYIGDKAESSKVFVIDQVDAQTQKFDEHKAILGVDSRDEAEALYVQGFSDGRGGDRLGAVTEMTADQFKDWVKNGDTTKPLQGETNDLSEMPGAGAEARQEVQELRPQDAEVGTEQTPPEDNNTPFDQKHRLSKPIKGKTGAEIVGYRWASTLEDTMYGERRVSDWSRAGTSTPTGRSIVHQFLVRTADGNETVMGVGAAKKALGMTEKALYSKAKVAQENQAQEKQYWDREEPKVFERSFNSPAEASRAWRVTNSKGNIEQVKLDEYFGDTELLEKDGKFFRTMDQTAITELTQRGWVKVDPTNQAPAGAQPAATLPATEVGGVSPVQAPTRGWTREQFTLPVQGWEKYTIIKDTRNKDNKTKHLLVDDTGQVKPMPASMVDRFERGQKNGEVVTAAPMPAASTAPSPVAPATPSPVATTQTKTRTPAQIANDERLRREQTEVNPDKDDIIKAISKLGGIDKGEAQTQWGNTITEFGFNKRQVFGKPALRKKGGLSIDKMIESLKERGYVPEDADQNTLFAAIETAIKGGSTASVQRQDFDAEMATLDAEREAEAAAAWEEDPFDFKEADLIDIGYNDAADVEREAYEAAYTEAVADLGRDDIDEIVERLAIQHENDEDFYSAAAVAFKEKRNALQQGNRSEAGKTQSGVQEEGGRDGGPITGQETPTGAERQETEAVLTEATEAGEQTKMFAGGETLAFGKSAPKPKGPGVGKNDLDFTLQEEDPGLFDDVIKESNEPYGDKVTKDQIEVIKQHLSNRVDGADLAAQLREHTGTPWANQVMQAILVREAMIVTMRGETPAFDSKFRANSVKKLREYLEAKGEEGLFAYLELGSILANPEKPENAVNASFTNCRPSKDCAKYCYAPKGRAGLATNIAASEAADLAVQIDPKRTAGIVARLYKGTLAHQNKKALRMNEKGDLSPQHIIFIKELNRRGVRTQVFSKRDELLSKLPETNLNLLSIDDTNYQDYLEGESLVAVVWRGAQDNKILEAFKGRVQVVLPIKIGSKVLPKEEISKMPLWARRFTCPIDAGTKVLPSKAAKGGGSPWTCLACDKNGGVGCFVGKVTAKLKAIEENGIDPGSIGGIIEQLKALEQGELDDVNRQELLGRLDLLTAQVRAGIDPGTGGKSDRGTQGYDEEVGRERQESAGNLGGEEKGQVNEDQLSFDFRSTANDADRDSVRKILEDRGRSDRRGRSLLGNAITKALRTKGGVSLLGQKVAGHADLAALAQVYRNPSYETFRVVFTKGGVVVGQTAISSRLPGASYVFEGRPTQENSEKGYADLKSQMENLEADGFWLIHNHPSGNVDPSFEDRDLSARFASRLDGYQGHVIINHNKYANISVGNLSGATDATTYVKQFADKDELLSPSVPHDLLGRRIANSDDVAGLTAELKTPDGYVSLISHNKAGVRGILEVPVSQVTNVVRMAAIVRRFAKQTGAQDVFATLPQGASEELGILAEVAVARGFLRAVATHDGQDFAYGNPTGQMFGMEIRGNKVAETEDQFGRTPATVTINGVERPVMNSEGQQIHATMEGIKNFWRWYDGVQPEGLGKTAGESLDSAGVYGSDQGITGLDGEGRPRVFYHGTSDDVSAFDTAHENRHDQGWLGRGVYVTTDKRIANAYANIKRGAASPNIMPVYAAVKNPFFATIDLKKSLAAAPQGIVDKITNNLIRAGFDGVSLVYDETSAEIVAFSPNQIKSATGNTGAFDSTKQDIRLSRKQSPLGLPLFSLAPNRNVAPVLDKDAADKIASAVLDSLGVNKERLRVVATESELPAEILEQAEKEGALGSLQGVLYEGQIYVVADQVTGPLDIEQIMAHEVNHLGGRKLFGPQRKIAYQQLFIKMGGINGMRKLGEKYGFDMQEYFDTADTMLQSGEMTSEERAVYLVDEVLAHLSQVQAGQTLPAKIKRAVLEFIGKIRAMLRDKGFKWINKLNDADLLNLVKMMNRSARDGGVTADVPSFIRLDKSERDRKVAKSYARDKIGTALRSDPDEEYLAWRTKQDAESAGGPEEATGAPETDTQLPAEPGYKAHPAFDHPSLGSLAREIADIASSYLELNLTLDDVKKDVQNEINYRSKTDPEIIPNMRALLKIAPLERLAADYPGWVEANKGSIGGPPTFARRPHGGVGPSPSVYDRAPQAVKNTVDYLRMKLQDKFIPLLRVQERLEQNGWQKTTENDAYRAEERFHGRATTRLEDFYTKLVEPFVEAIRQSRVSIEDLEQYLYATFAPERNAYIATIDKDMPDGGSGMTNKEAADILQAFEDAGKTQELETLADVVRRITAMQRNIIREEGLETEEAVDAWEMTSPNYVPMKSINDGKNKGSGIGTGFNVKGSGTKRALGRTTPADNILAHLFEQVGATIVRAEKVKVSRAFLKMAEENPGYDGFKIYDPEVPGSFPTKRALVKNPRIVKLKKEIATKKATLSGNLPDDRRQNLEWEIAAMQRELNNAQGMVVKTIFDQMGLRDESVLAITKEDGSIVYVHIADNDLARVMKNLNPMKHGRVFQTLAWTSRFLSTINTSLNPEFIVTNLTRDIQTALIHLAGEQSAKMAKDVVKGVPGAMGGIMSSLRGQGTREWSLWYERFRKAGGQVSFMDLRGMEDWQNRIKKMAGPDGAIKATKENVDKVLQVVADMNTMVENAVRLSAFRVARESGGMTEEEAASLAKNLTVNFNRKGELGPAMNALYMFANAGVQGSARIIHSLATSRTTRRMMGATIVMAIGLAEFSRMTGGEDDDGEDRWDKVEDYVKQNNLVFLSPDGDRYTIRLPYGYNTFVALGYTISDMMHNIKDGRGRGMDFMEAFNFMTSAILNSFNPLGGDDGLIKTLSPTLTDPLIEIATNENFMGRNIYPENLPFGPQKPDSQLYFRSASEVSKQVAEGLNSLTGGNKWDPGMVDISPETLDHIFDFMVGGAGRTIKRAVDVPFKYVDGELEPNNIPFWRQWHSKQLDYIDQAAFYDNLQSVTNAHQGVKEIPAADRAEFARENPEYKLYKTGLKYRNQMSSYRKAYYKAMDDGDKATAKTLRNKMLLIAKRFNRTYNDVVRQ